MQTVLKKYLTAPAHKLPVDKLERRLYYDFSDYHFKLSDKLSRNFYIVPSQIEKDEAFLFFFPIKDLQSQIFSLFNFHCFAHQHVSLEKFARNLGDSVRYQPLEVTNIFGQEGLAYRRNIPLKKLFKGAEHLISFIGGDPNMLVRDSHNYFKYRDNYYYSGMLHLPGNNDEYKNLRAELFEGIQLI